jgi:O-antigen ligase
MSSSLTRAAPKRPVPVTTPSAGRSAAASLTPNQLEESGYERRNWQERAIGLAPKLLALYVFLLFSRLFEASQLIGLGDIYAMLIVSALSLLVIFLGGDFLRASATPAGLLFLVFTFWAVLIMPFSSWRSESLSVFTSIWIKSVAAFFIVCGLSRSLAHTRKVFIALGWGAVVSLALVMLSGHLNSDRFQSFGSMGNANEVAFHLMLGLPFIVFLMNRVKIFWKIPLAGASLLSIVYALKTVSRAGIIIAAALFLISFFQVSFGNKIKILFVVTAGAVIGFLMLDQASLSRYLTLVNPDLATDEAARSARESGDARKYKLEQGIELTFLHPLAGVGMGDFVPASAELAVSKSEKPMWIASHNSYVQISSETGFPGFCLLFGVFVTCYIRLIQLGRAARRLGLKEIQAMSLCALLALVALSIHFFFDAIAWDYYLPMIGGLSMALVFSAQPLIAKAEESAYRGEITESGMVQTISTENRDNTLSQPVSVTPPPPPPARNPYRLGRRRSSN